MLVVCISHVCVCSCMNTQPKFVSASRSTVTILMPLIVCCSWLHHIRLIIYNFFHLLIILYLHRELIVTCTVCIIKNYQFVCTKLIIRLKVSIVYNQYNIGQMQEHLMGNRLISCHIDNPLLKLCIVWHIVLQSTFQHNLFLVYNNVQMLLYIIMNTVSPP